MTPEMEITEFEAKDIITTNNNDRYELDPQPLS